VYIGTFSSFGDPPGTGLQVGQVDRLTGALTVTGTVGDVPDASFFAFSLDRRTLYSTNELVPDGSVTALRIDDPQHPVILNKQPTRGAGPTHISVHPSGRYLFAANYTDGTVAVLRLESDGRVGESTDLVQHIGTDRAPHAHQVLTDPSGRWVVAVDLGADSVFVYRLNLGTGKLALHQQLRLPTGAGPRHLAFHPRGRFAYIVGELRSEITVAAWDAARGRLTPGQVIPTVGPGAPSPNFPAEIAVSRDGRFVYASNRGENSIATFTVQDLGRKLTFAGSTPTGGDWPRHFTLSPDERWLYVANQRSNTITQLPRDPATGRVGAPIASATANTVGIVLFR
jgi:6-phosphogluconolactonase